MQIFKGGSRSTRRGPDAYFSGTVWQDPIMDAPEPASVKALTVTFEPGARTAWHTHPLGQTLIITAGSGLVQKKGEAAQVVTVGDVVWFAPGEIHWHGAGPDTVMTHIAIQEALDGKAVDWMDHVDEDAYREAAGTR